MQKVEVIGVGSDPEVFVYAEHLQEIVSSIGLVGGTKEEPKPMSKEGFFVQEDNVLLEFNIPPAKERAGFVALIQEGLELLKAELPEGFIPLIKSSYNFPVGSLIDPRAFIMGCDPDYNAWSGERNQVPNLALTPNLRSGGGHVHLGYLNSNPNINRKIIKYFDKYLGIPSVILDTDKERRQLYGKAGAYRDKSYGVEYRTLSSFWLRTPELTGWVWDQVETAINHLNNDTTDVINSEQELITSIINSGDVESAQMYVDSYGIKLPTYV
jgi:hypothetical protein